MHTRADLYGSDPKLARIGLLCTLAPTCPLQFGSAIRTNEVRIKRMEVCGSDPFGSRENPRIGSKTKVQIGNEADFVYKRGLSTFMYFSSWLREMSTSNIYLSLIGYIWIRSRVHANYFGSDPVYTPEKFRIRSKKEWSRTDPLSCAQGLNLIQKAFYFLQHEIQFKVSGCYC